jgi:hypothetical protein
MPNYQNSKIYTIRCKNDPSLIYIGSTIQPLSKRWGGHKKDSLKHQHVLLYSTINNDWDNWYIELYEEYPCENKEQLCKKEGEIIRLMGNLNIRIEGRTKKEYYNDNIDKFKERDKHYYNDNKEKLLEKQKEYNLENFDKVKEYKKEYYLENFDKIKEYKKEYYLNRKLKKQENIL